MLNFIYYPISWILWLWHTAFEKLFGLFGVHVNASPNWSGAAWALAIVFLTITVRLILLYPMVKQIRTTTKMQELQPQIKALQKKYANDKQRMSIEMQKLQKENGVNMMMGCLPMLVQIPVFIGLFHVLRSFNKMSGGPGGLNWTVEKTRTSGNYYFSAEEVRSFLDARLFGAPLSGFIAQKKEAYAAFFPIGQYNSGDARNLFIAILAVTIPLLLLSAFATHMNARASIARQTPSAMANNQANIMNKMMLWFFPIMILGTGVMWHVGLLTYMVTNNIWTFFQQKIIFGKMDKEKKQKEEAIEESHKQTAPKPGVKPKRDKRGRLITVNQQESDGADTEAADVTETKSSDATEVSAAADDEKQKRLAAEKERRKANKKRKNKNKKN